MPVERSQFGVTPEGEAVAAFALQGAGGMSVRLIAYGARIASLIAPDREGRCADIVLGFDSLAGYLPRGRYFGATIGRVANRIAEGKFSLNGHFYRLSVNEGIHTLHGGIRGFDKRIWHGEPFDAGGTRGVRFTYLSPHMEEGFPGDLSVAVTYALTDANELTIEYHATTDQPTPVNLTNHSYFNLAGAGSGDALGHVLTLRAGAYTPVDDEKIPTGAICPVRGTPMDFTAPRRVGARIQDVAGDGYDFNFVLDPRPDPPAVAPAVPAVTVHEPTSGRTLTIRTTQPGVQFYSGGMLDGTIRGAGGTYSRFGAVVFEPQHFPDTVHHPNFPCTVLRPGEVYRQTNRYQFSTGPPA